MIRARAPLRRGESIAHECSSPSNVGTASTRRMVTRSAARPTRSSEPAGRLRDRPCRHWPPSSGSSNVSSSARRHGSSAPACNRSRSSAASSAPWRPGGGRPPIGRSSRTGSSSTSTRTSWPGSTAWPTSSPQGSPTRRCRSRGPTTTRWPTGRGSTWWPTRRSRAPTSGSMPGSRRPPPPSGAAERDPPSRRDPSERRGSRRRPRLHRPAVDAPRAVLQVTDPDGRSATFAIEAGGLTDRARRRQRPGRA